MAICIERLVLMRLMLLLQIRIRTRLLRRLLRELLLLHTLLQCLRLLLHLDGFLEIELDVAHVRVRRLPAWFLFGFVRVDRAVVGCRLHRRGEKCLLLLLGLSCMLFLVACAADVEVLLYLDAFFGAEWRRHVLNAADLPFGRKDLLP